MSRNSSRHDSTINSINDDSNESYQDNEGLPSYEDVLKEEQQGISYGNPSGNNLPSHSPQLPSRPPQRPPRPISTYYPPRPPPPNQRPTNPRPPTSSSTHNSHHNHHSTTSSNNVPRPTPQIPWVYPSNFYCPKCHNTGYKVKNGKSCRSCWRRFAPTNQINSMSTPSTSMWNPQQMYVPSPVPMPMGFNNPPNQGRPLVVRPGDPRLGGVVCGECRGTGRITFFLDEDICPLCNGLGRIVYNNGQNGRR